MSRRDLNRCNSWRVSRNINEANHSRLIWSHKTRIFQLKMHYNRHTALFKSESSMINRSGFRRNDRRNETCSWLCRWHFGDSSFLNVPAESREIRGTGRCLGRIFNFLRFSSSRTGWPSGLLFPSWPATTHFRALNSSVGITLFTWIRYDMFGWTRSMYQNPASLRS